MKTNCKSFILYTISFFLLLQFFVAPCIFAEDKILTVGWEIFEPSYYKDTDGKPAGLTFELLHEISKKTGYELKFLEMPWIRAVKEIEHGNLDLTAEAFKTSEREKFAYFSIPFIKPSYVLWVRKGESENYPFKIIKDLSSTPFQLGMIRGYSFGDDIDSILKKMEDKRTIQYVAKDISNYKKLLYFRIDGFIDHGFNTAYMLKKMGYFDKFEIHPMSFYYDDSFIMFSKNTVSPEKVYAFNNALQSMKDDGTYQQIINKYTK